MTAITPIGEVLKAVIAAAGWDRMPARDPSTAEEYIDLLRILYEAGRRDLPLGRLLEGHVDAVQIVHRHGRPEQIERLHRALAAGAMLGVWNAAIPGEPLSWDGDRLNGAKAYASGAGVLSQAMVTADTAQGAQMILLDLGRTPPVIDRDWWRTIGMQRSETHIVRWTDAVVADANLIGAPGAYASEPFFSGGALRFVAVHAGGIAGLFDRVRDHLVSTGRADDPFQAGRLAELFNLAEGATGLVCRTARLWFEDGGETRLARVAATRLSVAGAAERAMATAQQSVGLAGMFVEHPLSANLADLAVYLRQPAPDAQRLRVGRAVARGELVPKI